MIIFFFFFFIFNEETDTTVPVEIELENDEELEFFFDEKVRKVWHKQKKEWFFSVIDVCQVLTDTSNPRKYWSVLKSRLKHEGNELATICSQLKLESSKDGKLYRGDCVNTEQLLRIIQSIPSPKAEPFKLWLAQVGRERLEEYENPELAINRALSTYRSKGYSEAWIQQRVKGIEARNELTDEWKRAGIKDGRQYAGLTNGLTRSWSGKSVKEYKRYKGLRNENLRDNMTDIELALNHLAELSTTMLSKVHNPNGYQQSMEIAVDGGTVAVNARLELEQKLGQSVISPLNASTPALLDQKN